MLEAARRQQEKIASLSQTVSKNVQTISNLSQQFSRDKNYNESFKEQEIISKEKNLEFRESKVREDRQSFEIVQDKFSTKKKVCEDLESQRRYSLLQDKQHLKNEFEKLEKYQEDMKLEERENKKILALEQHRTALVKEQIEREEKSMWEEIEERQKSLFDKEKYMDEEKNEILYQIQQEKSSILSQLASIDNFRKNVNNLNVDLDRRHKFVDEKAREIKLELDYLQKSKEQLLKEKVQYENEAEKVHQMSVEVNNQTDIIISTRKELENQKIALEKKKQESLSMMAVSRSEKLKIDHRTKELVNRMKTFEYLKTLDISDIEIPKSEIIDIDVIKVTRITQTRSKSVVPIAKKFNSKDYLRELEPYTKMRDDFQTYLTSENSHLLNSKLAMETGLTKSFVGSSRVFSDASNSLFDRGSYMTAGSFAKQSDSFSKFKNFESFSSNKL